MSQRLTLNLVGFMMYLFGWSFIATCAVPFDQLVPVLITGLVSGVILFFMK